jgi:hypothetical protein
MAGQGETFRLNEDVVFRDRPMRVTGRVQLEGSSGQLTFRYALSDPTGAPVLLEEGEGRFALLRAFPPAAKFKTAKDTVLVGAEKYTLVGVRKLKLLDASGNFPGVVPATPLILSGMFEGLMGTLMRELIPGTTLQMYYLLKPLPAGELVSAATYAAGKDAAAQAAAARALNGD